MMRRLLLGVGALLTIAVILVGVPIALIVIAGNPLPSAVQVHNTLTLVPDYGNVILLTKVLPCLGWVAWILFAAPLLVEIAAGITGRKTTKRIWLVKGQQFAAAALVAAVLFMFAGTSAPHTAPAHAEASAASPTISISLPEPARSHLAAPEPTIEPAAITPASTAPATQTLTHIVVPGDNLWDISETYYGVGTRDLDIFRASTGIVQADGQRLTNPNLIRPGWRLTVPDVPAPSIPATSVPAPVPSPDPSGATHPLEFGNQIAPDPSSIPGAGTATSHPTKTAPAPKSTVSSKAKKSEHSEVEVAVPLSTAGGVVGLLAATFLLVLGGRRLNQRRRRRTGERIEMPAANAANFEQELRMVADPLGLADIDHALRLLQIHATEAGRGLPELLAVRLAEQVVALYFLQPTDLPAPFEPVTSDRTVWTLRPGVIATPPRAGVSPYPALVIIGVDDNEGVLLVDLEQLGVLNVLGDEELAQGVLAALAGELAGNPWGEQIQVTLVGMPLAFPRTIDRFRIQHADDVEAVLPTLRIDLETRAAALHSYGLNNVHAARVRAGESESWAPHLVILNALPDEPALSELAQMASEEGPLGFALVALGDLDATRATIRIESAFRAELQLPGGTVPPVPFTPQLLRSRELELLQDLLNTAESDSARPTIGEPQAAPAPAVPERGLSPIAREDDALELGERSGPTSDIEPLTLIEPSNIMPDHPPGPYLRLLGPVEVDGLSSAEPMPGRGVELMAYLLLRRGPVDGLQLQRAFWPDTPDAANNQRGLAKRVRVALGHSPSGEWWLPENVNHHGYMLHPAIRSDWDDFQAFVSPNPEAATTDDLVSALRLVRGTPFAGSNTRRWWQWIAIPQEEMIAAVMDAADELGNRALGSRSAPLARYAARIQQAVDPLNESGWRIELRFALQAGDVEGFREILTDLYARIGGEDPDYDVDDETQTLIDQANQRIRA